MSLRAFPQGLLQWSRQRLARVLFPYGAVRSVLRGPLRGFRYEVSPGMGLAYALGRDWYGGSVMGTHIRPGMTVYDIGANRGQMALLFAKLVGPTGKVVSFEPLPELCRSIERNVALNELGNVSVKCLAVAQTTGVQGFHFNPKHSTQGKLDGVEASYIVPSAQIVEVNTDSLDALMRQGAPTPDFIKIDVEGAAASILRGARELLGVVGPAIWIELHGPEEQAGVRDYLLPSGYRLESLSGEPVEDPTTRWVSPLFCSLKT